MFIWEFEASYDASLCRFHELSESDEAKRSCHIGLPGHIKKCGKILSSPMEKFQTKMEEPVAGGDYRKKTDQTIMHIPGEVEHFQSK